MWNIFPNIIKWGAWQTCVWCSTQTLIFEAVFQVIPSYWASLKRGSCIVAFTNDKNITWHFFHGLLLAYRTFSRLLPYYSILFQPIYPLSLRQRRTWIRRGTRLISGCPFQRPPRSCSSDGAGHNTTALTTQPRGGHDLDNVVGIFGDVSELCDDWLPHGRDLANECMARAQMLIEFDKMHSPSFRHKIGKHK